MNPGSLHKTPKEALSVFYKENNLGDDGGNSSSSVKIEIGKNFCFYFPNFDQRRKAVLKHDIHHLLTGYNTSFKGECEISAWEIASGCKKYRAAFFINTSGVMIGLLITLPGVLSAFARGRKTKNLYSDELTPEEQMNLSIEELRKRFYLDVVPKETKPGLSDILLILSFAVFGAVYSVFSILTLPFIAVYSIYVHFKN